MIGHYLQPACKKLTTKKVKGKIVHGFVNVPAKWVPLERKPIKGLAVYGNSVFKRDAI